MTLELKSLPLLSEAMKTLEAGFRELPEFNSAVDIESLRHVLFEVAEKMQDNLPYPHPFYVGHMMQSPHPIARLAYMLALWINPNNHAFDGGRASSTMEKEAVAEIARMLGWQTHLGHLCGGGTMANLEALWISGCLSPGKKIVASQQAHFTHERLCAVLRVPFQSVPCDKSARMDLDALRRVLGEEEVAAVVVTIGTTATGSVDPLPEVLELRDLYGFRVHADAAYGGYFVLLDDLRHETRAAYDRLSEVDSIVIDPHKHGLQPYGCGCVLFKDLSVGRFYRHDSAYTYLTSNELHLGEISLECSRPGASAVALWATQRLLPLAKDGEFARGLAKSRFAALKLYDMIRNDPRFIAPVEPELDIVVWTVKADSASKASRLARALFDEAERENVHMAIANLPRLLFEGMAPKIAWDQDHITCLRTCVMKPEHLEWMDKIWQVIEKAASKIVG